MEKLVLKESEVIAKLEVKYNGIRNIPTCLEIEEIDKKCIIALTLEQTKQMVNKLLEIIDKVETPTTWAIGPHIKS